MVDETFGTPSKALEAEKYFVDTLGYKQVRPVKITVSQPSGRKQISCYGLEYVRPEFSDEVWLYLLVDYVDFKSIYKRPHYYRRYLPLKDRTYAKGKFTFDGEDWYITGYTTEDSLSEQYIEFHPFGHHIGMRAWTGDNPIDCYESEKPRLVMSVDDITLDDYVNKNVVLNKDSQLPLAGWLLLWVLVDNQTKVSFTEILLAFGEQEINVFFAEHEDGVAVWTQYEQFNDAVSLIYDKFYSVVRSES